MFNCPVCQSENTQSLRMVCESGTATTRSGGIGVGSNGGVGIGLGASTSQSTLAASHNPGPEPKKGDPGGCAGAIAMVLGVFSMGGLIGGEAVGAGLCFLFVALGIGIYAVKAFVEGKDKYQDDLMAWKAKVTRFETGWLCHRCGNSWVPE